MANKIMDEPNFAWWIKDILHHHDHIIHAIQSCYWQCTHKFCVCVPKTVLEALELDKDSNTDFWYKAVVKEKKNVMPTFKLLDENEMVQIG